MSTKLVLAGLLGAGMVAAAAGGGYLALRQNVVERPGVIVPTDTVVVPAPADAPANRQLDTPPPSRPAPSAASAPVAVRQADRRAPAAAPTVTQAPASDTAGSAAQAQPAAAPLEPQKADASETRNEPAPAPVYEPAKPRVEELTIAPDAVIGIRLESTVSSDTAQVEDKVTARVSRDVTVGGQTAISSGARLEGVVASVERGGKFKDRARIGLRFQSLVLADGTRLPIQTETILRESESPTGSAATKVGASAAVGGVIGAVLGGKKGAAIGAAVGAAGGSGAVMAGSGVAAVLPAGTPLTVRLVAPVTVAIERQD